MPRGFRNRRSARPRKQRLTVERPEAHQMLAADLVISEFLAINDGVAFDEDGDTSDWIEIHNPTSQKVALSGWSLTDEATDLDKWGFPADTIAAGEYLIVFASQKDRSLAGAELHTNFKLDGDGEYLALMAPGDEIASEFSPAFPHQREDVSFGTGQLVEVTTLIGSGAPLKAWVPSGRFARQHLDRRPAAGRFRLEERHRGGGLRDAGHRGQ